MIKPQPTAADFDDDPRTGLEILRELEPRYFAVLDGLIRQCEIESLAADIDAVSEYVTELLSRGRDDEARSFVVDNLKRKRRIDVLVAEGGR